MSERREVAPATCGPTRRQVIVGRVVALGGLAVGTAIAQDSKPPQKMAVVPSAGPEGTRTSLHQEIVFVASPERVYEALLDSKQFAAFTRMPAEISREA